MLLGPASPRYLSAMSVQLRRTASREPHRLLSRASSLGQCNSIESPTLPSGHVAAICAFFEVFENARLRPPTE